MTLLFRLLGKQKIFLSVSLFAMLMSAGVTLWWNAQLSVIINAVSAGSFPLIDRILRALLTMLMMGVIQYISAYLKGFTSEHLTHDLRMGYARHLSSLPHCEVEKLNTGEQLSKLQNEVAGVSGFLNANFFQLIDDAVRFLSTFVWLLFLNPLVTLGTNIPSFLLVGYVFWSSRAISAATQLSQAAKAEMNRYADSLLTLFPIMRLFDTARIMRKGYLTAVQCWEGVTSRAERTRARLMSLSALLSYLPLMLLFLVGGHWVIEGKMSVGTLYIFINLSGNVSGVMMNMPGYIAAFRQFSANMKRLEPVILLNAKGE